MKHFILSIIISFVALLPAVAQTTIGSALKPNEGALLDIKENNNVDTNNSTKGIVFPRVDLQDPRSLKPCLQNENATLRLTHKGLIVYNTKISSVFNIGLYIWDGDLWQPIGIKEGQLALGPWNKIGTNEPSTINNQDSYLNARAIIGGNSLLENATLSIHGNTHISGNLGIEKQLSIGNIKSDLSGILLDLSQYNDATAQQGGRSADKGFLLPRVVLENNNNLSPLVTGGGSSSEQLRYRGTVVYHIGGNNIPAGQKIWDGSKWNMVITDVPPAEKVHPNFYDLKQNAKAVSADQWATELPGRFVPLQLGKADKNGEYFIPIEEPGSYVFVVRIYGESKLKPQSPGYIRSCFYLTLMVDGQKKDVQEFNTTNFAKSVKINGTGMLSAANIPKGAKVQITLSYWQYGDGVNANAVSNDIMLQATGGGGSGAGGMRADKTSLVYWKL